MKLVSQINIFNAILDQFFVFLEEDFEEFRSDIYLSKAGIDILRRSNPKLALEQFMNFVKPYKEKIFECDEDFFVNFETNLKGDLTQDDFLFGSKLKSMWMTKEPSVETKAKIFYYFQKLIKCGEKCGYN